MFYTVNWFTIEAFLFLPVELNPIPKEKRSFEDKSKYFSGITFLTNT